MGEIASNLVMRPLAGKINGTDFHPNCHHLSRFTEF